MADANDLIAQRLSAVLDTLAQAQAVTPNGLSAYDARLIITRARAAIGRYAPAGSAYEEEALAIDSSIRASPEWKAEQLAAIVHALRDDYAGGGLLSVQEIVHADLFDDFLDMAEELSTKGYIGPAAVLAGTVLEEHLRKLAAKHGLSAANDEKRPKAVETLGTELRKAGALTEVQRKSISAWYSQRNEAAHGHTDNLHQGDVDRMIDGVRDFVARHLA